MKSFTIVTIDGGAASGKSSTAKEIARRFRFFYVDTGSFYRTVTLALLRAGVPPGDEDKTAKTLPALPIATAIENGSGIMTLDGTAPTAEIRSREVNENVSLFASSPAVRSYLLQYQRGQAEVARENGFAGLVMEGRDIGSVIFPDADFRFFLSASEDERERRRRAQGQQDQIGQRDQLDTKRATAPLICPPGAIQIDSTALSLSNVVEEMARYIE